jgi:hypothetical protein
MKAQARIIMVMMVCGAALAALAWLSPAPAVAAEKEAASFRVGTFDSRAVAIAYYRSGTHMEIIKNLKQEHAAAEAAGDEELAKELSTRGQDSQHLAHLQGFGSYPIDEILALIQEEIPGIAASAGVDVIVSKWDIVHALPEAEFVDVTLAMVEPFEPDSATLKLIKEELPKVDPLPLEELEKHDH